MKHFALPLIVAAVVAALAGCTSQSAGTVSAGNVAAPVAGANIVTLAFGKQYDGPTLSIGLSTPQGYTASDTAVTSNKTGRAVTFNIRVADNDPTQKFSTVALDLQATSGSAIDTDIEDSANNVGSSFADILPRHSLTWQIAFAVPLTARDMTVQISSLGGGKTIVFNGNI